VKADFTVVEAAAKPATFTGVKQTESGKMIACNNNNARMESGFTLHVNLTCKPCSEWHHSKQ